MKLHYRMEFIAFTFSSPIRCVESEAVEEKPFESIASQLKSLQEENTAKDAKLSELKTITNLLAKNFQVLEILLTAIFVPQLTVVLN